MRSFNVLFVALLLWSMIPTGVEASYNKDVGESVKVEQVQEGSGYFKSSIENIQSEVKIDDSGVSNVQSRPRLEPVGRGRESVYANTGGTIVADGNYTVHTFTSNGTFTAIRSGNVSVLVVAGGGSGGGGNGVGGGGGAGGLVFASSNTVTTGGLSVIVGIGGNGTGVNMGQNGTNSSFNGITAYGGGGGGTRNGGTGTGLAGYDGGCGGGGGGADSGAGAAGGTASQGFAGGTGWGNCDCGAGGGGGMGALGGNAGNGIGGNGGAGLSYSINGTSMFYAGGGGGAGTAPGSGGSSIGGAGSAAGNGGNGVAYTGSGGGGGGIGKNGGNGATGVVIIRCLTSEFSSASVDSIAASSVEETIAIVGGNVTAMGSGSITSYGFQYGTTGSYGSWCNVTETRNAVFSFYQALGSNTTALSQGTFYYYRAWVYDTVDGYAYGSQLTFLTKPDPPTGLAVTAYNTTALYLTWTLGTGADYTYIRYSNVSCPLTTSDGTFGANVTAPTANVIISGLTTLSTYYFSVWSHSTGVSTYQFSDSYVCGDEMVPGLPTVTTNDVSGYGNDWATVSGTQTAGYPVSTLFGFQYGSSPGVYSGWANTTTTVAGGLFTATISGLTPSSTYYYRAFAMNAYGIGYGAELTFSTSGTAILYESYQYGCNTTWNQNYENFVTMGSNWTTVQGQNWVAQNFTASSSHSVNQVVIWAKRSATAAAGYMYVGIRDANAGQPNTPDLGLGLYSIAYVSTSGGPIEVTLENEIQLNSGSIYAIVVRAPGADSTNYVQVQFNIAGGASGQMETSTDGGVAWIGSAYDVNYVIIGRPQPIYGNVQAAQTFTVGSSPHTAYKVRLILGRVGQPGNVYVSIRNYTGGVLSNADLAIVALNGNAITLDKAMYDCVLVPEKSLEASKQYAIIVTAPSGDRYNYILMCADSGAGYASGVALMSINAGLTWTTQTFDYNFEVWGNACLSVLNAKVFKNYLSTGDWLITAETLNVSPPYYDNNLDPSTLYILSFMGLTGTTYASTPCGLWDKGPIVIYLNPTQAAALTWGGNYKVRLGDLSSTVYSEYALLSTDWSASSLIYLDNWVRLCAKDMEAYKTAKTGTPVSYTTYVANKGYVLNQDGGAIFSQACPRLAYVRPNLFQITSNQPDITTTPAPTNVGFFSQDYHTALGSYLSGMIDDGAAAAGIGDPKVFGGIIMLALYAIVAFGTVMKGFAWAGMIAAFPVILLGMYYGLLDVTMIIIILAIMAFLFMREFFFKGM